ncbi:hypothetical protein GCM10010435_76400 [Winogradskya consettensis]|uniref:Lipoprotein n=1 Tax=Winogradskya consettensis TaxID=113560 RepID=A0A919VS67_9ACTN|nr:hypothetical protein [Actinoplanes consettensis]GIM74501.1 hypothetical protein Aco04nite_40610 [Actinoplanes consettensis]
MYAILRAVATATVLVLAACTSGASGAPVPVPSDPVTALSEAAGRLGTQPARFTFVYGTQQPLDAANHTGLIDPATGHWEITGNGWTVRRIGDDVYIRLTKEPPMPLSPGSYAAVYGTWIHQRVPVGGELSYIFGADFPWSLARGAAHGTDITRIGERSFRGSVAVAPGEEEPRNRGFLADLDEQGRFTSVAFLSDTQPAASGMSIAFSGFGTPADIQAPSAGETVDGEAYLTVLIEIGLSF